MTKSELIEALKDFQDDMEVKVNPYYSRLDGSERNIESIHKCYYKNGDIIIINIKY